MTDFSEYRLVLAGGRSLLGFTGGPEEGDTCPVFASVERANLSPLETVRFGWSLVNRWNACEDADAASEQLESLLRDGGIVDGSPVAQAMTEVRAILRRAINGEG